MASFDFNLSNDSFVLDRDQAAYLNNPAAQSTLKTLYNSHSEEQSPIIQDVYEIINTGGTISYFITKQPQLQYSQRPKMIHSPPEDLLTSTRSYQTTYL